MSSRKEVAPGFILFREGDQSRELYMLITGGVEVSKQGQIIASIQEGGSIIGEISFLLGSPRTATVRTTASSEFLVIEDVEQLIETQPALMARVARVLAERLAAMDEKFVALRRTILGT